MEKIENVDENAPNSLPKITIKTLFSLKCLAQIVVAYMFELRVVYMLIHIGNICI